jgi:hypothetical protein
MGKKKLTCLIAEENGKLFLRDALAKSGGVKHVEVKAVPIGSPKTIVGSHLCNAPDYIEKMIAKKVSKGADAYSYGRDSAVWIEIGSYVEGKNELLGEVKKSKEFYSVQYWKIKKSWGKYV